MANVAAGKAGRRRSKRDPTGTQNISCKKSISVSLWRRREEDSRVQRKKERAEKRSIRIQTMVCALTNQLPPITVLILNPLPFHWRRLKKMSVAARPYPKHLLISSSWSYRVLTRRQLYPWHANQSTLAVDHESYLCKSGEMKGVKSCMSYRATVLHAPDLSGANDVPSCIFEDVLP